MLRYLNNNAATIRTDSKVGCLWANGYHASSITIDHGIPTQVIKVYVKCIDDAIAVRINAQAIARGMLPVYVAGVCNVCIAAFIGSGKSHSSEIVCAKGYMISSTSGAVFRGHDVDAHGHSSHRQYPLIVG